MASASASNTATASMYWRVMAGLSSSISVYFGDFVFFTEK